MSSPRMSCSARSMAAVASRALISKLCTRANKFARREHPVRFSNELVDSLQKNTFVSRLEALGLEMMDWD